jgi:hypothetical protein
VGFRQRAAEHGEVLAEDINLPPVHRAPAGNHPVAGHLDIVHAEIGAAMGDEHVEFLEAALVQQQLDALARGQLALGMLRLDAAPATTQARLGSAVLKLFEDVLHGDSLPCGFAPFGSCREWRLQKL